MRNQLESQHLVESTHASNKKFTINRIDAFPEGCDSYKTTEQLDSLINLKPKIALQKSDLTPGVV